MALPAPSTTAFESMQLIQSEFESSFEAYVVKLRSPAAESNGKRNISQHERFLSVGLGTVLSIAGLSQRRLFAVGCLGLGTALIHRGATGHCHGYRLLGWNSADHDGATVISSKQGVQITKAITVQRTPAELYAYWRQLKNLPKIMQHLKSVEPIDHRTSRWIASGPLKISMTWDAEIFNERENEMLAWQSLPGGDVETAGSVHFTALEHDRGTLVRILMRYNPPAGRIGAKLTDFLGIGLDQQIEADLQRFKSLMETGEIATTHGQPEGPA